MNKYESVIIINPNVEKEGTKELVQKFSDLINTDGKLEKVDEMGVKKLAYEIQKNKEGNYVVFYFEANPKEEEKQFNAFEEEINFVCGPEKPLFILCGNDVKKAFSRFNKNNKYNSIIIPHYSSNGGVTKKIIEILCDKKGC